MLQVQGIMVVLTRHGLVMKHMDMLWNIAQKEDAHEAVKAHMYDLLAEVAADFEAEELGALLERLRARLSTPLLPADTLRLLGLLERLAQADTAVRVPFRTAPSCTLSSPRWTCCCCCHPNVTSSDAQHSLSANSAILPRTLLCKWWLTTPSPHAPSASAVPPERLRH